MAEQGGWKVFLNAWQFRGVPPEELSVVAFAAIRLLTLLGFLSIPFNFFFHVSQAPTPVILIVPLFLFVGVALSVKRFPIPTQFRLNITVLVLLLFGSSLILRYPFDIFVASIPMLTGTLLVNLAYGFRLSMLVSVFSALVYASLLWQVSDAPEFLEVALQCYLIVVWSLILHALIAILFSATLHLRFAASASARALSSERASMPKPRGSSSGEVTTLGATATDRTSAPSEDEVQVLIVDDDRFTRSQLETFFRQYSKVQTRSAGSGADALRLLADSPSSFILVDYFMPGMDGAEFIRLLRDSGNTSLVLGLTTATMNEEHDQLWKAGVDLVMTKPPSTVALQSVLRHRFGLNRMG